MINRAFYAFVALLSLTLYGCVFINVPLPQPEPLTEMVIGGEGRAKVLVMDISGVITSEEEKSGLLGVQTAPSITARIKEELTKASEDEDVVALILRVNTPGGSVTTCDIIAHEIKSFKDKRKIPVIAELMDVAASGGYYIASTADVIIAHPTTVTGSIGVVAYGINATGLLDRIGVTDQTIKSGDKKDIGSPIREMTREEREILQSVIDSMFERFLDVVMEGRPGRFTRQELEGIADGRVYTAGQARKLKLVDSIGYMDDAVDLARKKAGVDEARIITYSVPGTYRNNIYSALSTQSPSTLNLVNIDASALTRLPGTRFMYLWLP